MSAFIVDDQTINRIVTWMHGDIEANRYSPLRKLAQEYDVNLSDEEWVKKLAVTMFQMNCDAVNARYGDGQAETFRSLDFTYRPVHTPFRMQVLKSLQCWKYQCTEGRIPQSPLYHFFEEVEKTLALTIVMDLPAYDKAEWG